MLAIVEIKNSSGILNDIFFKLQDECTIFTENVRHIASSYKFLHFLIVAIKSQKVECHRIDRPQHTLYRAAISAM